MIKFKKQAIKENQELISGELKRIREEKKIKLSKASLDLRISEKYLESLEIGDISGLPEGVYAKNFLKRYAEYLGLDPDKIALEYFDTDQPARKNNKNVFARKVPHAFYFLTIPRLLKNIFLFALAMTLFSYLAYAVYNIISPPNLIINTPIADYQTTEKSLLVSGVTEAETNVHINDEAVLVNRDGRFEKNVNLQMGINNIIVSAQKKYSRTKYENRKVLVSDPK